MFDLMKIILATILIIAGTILLFAEMDEFIMLTFIIIKAVSIIAVMVGLELLEVSDRLRRNIKILTPVILGMMIAIVVFMLLGWLL